MTHGKAPMSDGSRVIPEEVQATLEKAAAFAQAGDWQPVESLCALALRVAPDNVLALYLMALACIRLSKAEAAIEYLTEAAAIDDGDADRLSLLAGLLCSAGRGDEALPYLRRAAAMAPTVESLNQLGAVCADAGLLGEAIAAFRRSLDLQPAGNIASAGLYPLLRLACEWTEEAQSLSRQIDALNAAALAAGAVAPEPPFDNVHRVDDPAENFALARSWSRQLSEDARRLGALSPTARRRPSDGRIRIGYLSGDLHDHAIGHLTRGLYGRHDRRRFTIHAYSYGPDDGSAYRQSIRESCDSFTDLVSLDDKAAAERIAADGIDIMVELKSYTRRHRLGICAFRPAPVQVTYLGFPGTTGAAFFDYAITDHTVTPPGADAHFSEQLVRMPYAYQCNDDAPPPPDIEVKKSDIFGNSEVFVYCSFNNPIKLDPLFFDVWIGILRRTPNSVLWILQNNPLAQRNLTARAEAGGVDGGRVHFAEMLPRDQHIARMAVADLALDTRIYNGHTTTSDALRSGLPVVTMEGRHFASRVSASLLRAINLPELVASTPESFAALALHYARSPEALAELRARLVSNRATAPLFDTTRFTRSLEAAYDLMWDCYRAGKPPRGFDVPDIAS